MKPQTPITNPQFKYVKAAATDIKETWIKNGWTPPDPVKQEAVRNQLNKF